jgi:hypothetical protein
MGAECSRCGYDIYDECGHCKVIDERDRLREALEAVTRQSTTRFGAHAMHDIATDALDVESP